MKFRLLAPLLAALAVSLVSGCGGKGSDGGGTGYVRLLNTTTDYASLDLYANDGRVTAAVATNASGDYVALGAATYTFKLKRADQTTTLLSTDRALTGDVHDTLIAYSTAGTLRTTYVADTETAPTSGTGKLRIFNASVEAGSLDLYVAPVGGTLDDVSATASGIGTERFSAFTEIAAGTYRIVVTGAGDKTDIRLDLPSVTLSDQQIATLMLTSTPGGVLVNGLLSNQGAANFANMNTSARVRLVADTTGNGVVAATINGVSLTSGLRSPGVGSYTLVPAGNLASTLTVNGTAVVDPGLTATAGADLTMLVAGTTAAPQVTLLNDDNRPPTTTSNAKLRLVHGLNNLNGTVTLTADYSAVASEIAFGTASSATSLPFGTTYRLEASSSASTAELYVATDVSLQATRVYTVFLLGDASSPQGMLRRDR